MSLPIDTFLERIQKITDKDFQYALALACGKHNPFTDPEKFRNMRKKYGSIKLTPILLKAFENYFIRTASQPATKMFKTNYVKQTLKDLELRMIFLPKAIDNLALFKEADISKKDVCVLACRGYPYGHYFGEEHQSVVNTKKKNCNACATNYSNVNK